MWDFFASINLFFSVIFFIVIINWNQFESVSVLNIFPRMSKVEFHLMLKYQMQYITNYQLAYNTFARYDMLEN